MITQGWNELMEQRAWHDTEAHYMCVLPFLAPEENVFFFYHKAPVAEKWKFNVKRIINNNETEAIA